MTVFAHFPREILSSITQCLYGFDIALLWLTGDAGLRARLESGGVTRFKLELRQEKTRKWPKLINRFLRLESLSIKPKANHSIWFRDVDLFGVSPALKHLEMSFTNCEHVLLGIPFVVEDLHPDPIHSPATEAEMGLSPLPFANHFKELQTLVLHGGFHLPHLLLPQLPQTLIRLHFPYQKVGRHVFGALPPHLTILDMPNLKIIEEGTTFPPELTFLSLGSLVGISNDCLSSIPKSVTSLALPYCCTANLNIFEFLPSDLASLQYGGCSNRFTDERIERFPQSLRRLDLRVARTPLQFDSFPTGLQTLIVGRITPSTIGNFRLLPPTLTKLSVTTTYIPEECLKFFPNNLRSLWLVTRFKAPESPYSFMSTLEYLHVTNIDLQALRSMPRLTHLECDSLDGSDYGALKTLYCLRGLHISDEMDMDREFLSSLPAALEKLEICAKNHPKNPKKSDFILEDSLSQYLPRSLLSLNIDANSTLSDSFIAHLPPRLTELSLGKADSLSNDAIRFLPRTLVILNLPWVTQITDDGIRHLPASLTDCRLERVHLLTDKCAALFPRHMTRLCIDRCEKITNAAIPHFPRTLVTLDVHRAKLTVDCIPNVPPLLTYFRVGNVPLGDNWDPKISSTSLFISSLIQHHWVPEETK